jgi:small basic protein (TIGR04137 family)
MSLDKSLKRSDLLRRRRNVLTRAERIERLMEDEEFDPEEESIFGLPKVKPAAIVVQPPAAPEEEEEEEELAEGVSEAEAEVEAEIEE